MNQSPFSAPVINAILVAGEPVLIHVSFADNIDTDTLKTVDNAKIIIYENDAALDTLYEGQDGIYQSTLIAKPLSTYKCEVEIAGYSVVSASTYIPESTGFRFDYHINEAIEDEEGLKYPAVVFTITNIPEELRYYQVVLRGVHDRYTIEHPLVKIEDPVILNEGIPIAVFSNEIMGDETYTMSLNYQGQSYGGSRIFFIEFRSVSYEYYAFTKQLYLYEIGRYPDGIESTLATYPLYSNVENGYGIFAGYSAVLSDTIDRYKN